MLTIQAFGGVRARLGDAPVDLGGPRQRAVLGLLVAAGRRTVSADRFLDELWNGEPPPSGAGALQAYISRLRSATEPGRPRRQPPSVLVSAPPGYALSLPTDAVDTWRFGALVARAASLDVGDAAEVVGAVDEALALWTDEPFADYPGEGWAADEADRLRRVRGDAVEVRARALLRLGDGPRAVASLEQHAHEHPLREQAVALLARAYYQSGRQADALLALSDLRRRLVDELGVDPGPDLRTLEGDILNQAAHLTGPAAGPATRAEPPAPPARTSTDVLVPAPPARPSGDRLVGREDELARLDAAARAVRRRPAVVWVEGEAGFGKSALVSHFADASVSDWSVLRSRCSQVTGAPPGHAWHEVLDQLEGRSAVPDASGPDRRRLSAFDLAERLGHLLRERGTRTMVLVEDVHRADDETLQVLWHLVESADAPVLVVATYRGHEVGREMTTTLALTAERTLDRIALRGLGERDARDLLAEHVDLGLPESVWRRLVDRSAGNPLFLKHLAQLVSAEGLTEVDTLPAAIRDLLLRRIGRLPEATADALSRVAVLGRDIDLDLVLELEQECGDPDEDTVAAHLDAGLVAGLLESPRPGELRFAHDLVRDTFYGRVPPLRRTRLHRAALAAYRRQQPDRLDAVAHHVTAALDRRSASEAVPLLRAAAARSNHTGAVAHLPTALRALDLEAGADARLRDRFEVRLDLVRALARAGDTVGASAERARAIAEAQALGATDDLARAWSWPAPMTWSRSRAEAADETVIREVRDLLGRVADDDLALRVELLNAVVVEADPWNVAEVVAAADELLVLAEQVDDAELRCRALNAAVFATFARDDTGTLERLGRRLLAVADAAGLHEYAAVAHMVLQSAALGRADVGTAAAHIEAAVRAGTSGQLPELLLLATIFEATTRLLQDDLDGARDGFEQVCRELESVGDPNTFYIRLWTSFAVEFAAGDTSGLVDDARRMTQLMPWHSTDLLVVALLDAGRRDEAVAAWRPATMQRDATWLFDAAVRAHLVVELGEPDEARQVYHDLLPWSGQLTRTLNGALSMGPVDHYLALLADALGDPEAAHEHRRRLPGLTGPDQATTWAGTWSRAPDGGTP